MTTHDALMSFRSCCWKSTSSGHEALISVWTLSLMLIQWLFAIVCNLFGITQWTLNA
jgi:hypothetical protein